jgi:hypothetical protein
MRRASSLVMRLAADRVLALPRNTHKLRVLKVQAPFPKTEN